MTIPFRPIVRFARRKRRSSRLVRLAAMLVAASALMTCPAASFAQPNSPPAFGGSAATSNPYVAQRFLVAAMVGMALFVLLRSSRREKEVKPLDDMPTV